MRPLKPTPELDRLFPPRGLCGLCGGPDARHRLWDVLLGRLAAGENAAQVSDDFEVEVRKIRALERAAVAQGLFAEKRYGR